MTLTDYPHWEALVERRAWLRTLPYSRFRLWRRR